LAKRHKCLLAELITFTETENLFRRGTNNAYGIY
jgi:hypothetical protein